MFRTFLSFVINHPGLTIILLLIIIVLVAYIRDLILHEHIYCKVVERTGRFRYTSVRRRRYRGTYEVHISSGAWFPLTSDQIKMIEENRVKYDIHGRHIHPEIHV